jgi:GNAT superfamily N-acetyltransferase
MVIRRIKATDFNQLCHIGAQLDEDAKVAYPSMDPNAVMVTMVDSMSNPNKLLAVAETNGDEGAEGAELAGLVVGHIDRFPWSFVTFGQIELIVVARKFRGTLAGKMLADGFSSWAKERGASLVSMRYSSGLNRGRATQFLKRIGFHPVGFELHREI